MCHLLSPSFVSLVRLVFVVYTVLAVTAPTSASTITSSKQATAQPSEDAQPTLLFVAELCRHGDRTPLAAFPSAPLSLNEWTEGVGQLTAVGQRAHYNLGRSLRDKYVTQMNYLSSTYNASEIYIRSTDVDRTLMSAYSQLMGLYPAGSASIYDVREKFGAPALTEDEGGLPNLVQTIPVHTENSKNDKMLLPGRNCRKHDVLMQNKYASNEFLKKIDDETKFLRVLGNLAGVKDENAFTMLDLIRISDNWKIFQAHSVPLPEGVTTEIFQHAENVSDWLLDFSNQGREIHRLRAGLTLNSIREFMAVSILHHQELLPAELLQHYKKFVLFSAHDTTVAATLAALQVFDGKYPPYNSTIFWHLWKRPDDSMYVTVEFNGQLVKLPGCSSEECPLIEYEKATKSVTIYGELARDIECLTGIWKFASMFSNWVSGKSARDRSSHFLDITTFGSGGPGTPPSPGQDGMHLPSAFMIGIAAVLALAGAISMWRRRSKYVGYSDATNDDKDDSFSTLSERDHLTNRTILT